MHNTSSAKAGIIGAGFISDYHIEAIQRQSGVDLAAVCDLRKPAAELLAAKQPGAKVYTDLHEMLASENLDVVHILTQPDSHFFLAKTVMESGCNVILEKPVTTNSKEAEDLKQIADKHGVRIAINHNFVFSRPFNKLKSILNSGELGPIKSIRIVWKKVLPQINFGPWDLWMLREPGNILFETGSHTLSELLGVIEQAPTIKSVDVSRPKTLPSGSTFYRRWAVRAQHEDISISIDTAFDQGYEQHFVEVEGIFGVARADIENDFISVDQPTGREYDFERFSINRREGLKRFSQSVSTFCNYAASKLSSKFTGNPYETSMLNGIAECYTFIEQGQARRECTIDYALNIAKTAESIQALMPEAEKASDTPSIPKVVKTPALDAKILVIGASGFIGKKLLLALIDQGTPVRAMVRNPSSLVGVPDAENCEVIVGDFRDAEIIDQALQGVESVVHLAVAHGNSLQDYLTKDSDPTVEFAKKCQERGIKKFVYTGTIDSLPLAHKTQIKESDGVDKKLSRRNNYGHSKAITEKKLLAMYSSEQFPVVIVRPAIVVGEGGPANHVGVAKWSGLGSCAFWGDGSNAIPLVLVEDIVSAMLSILSTEGIEGNTYNLSAESSISAREYVSAIENALGCSIRKKNSSPVIHFMGDFFKWCIKIVARHPDKARMPSVHDWKCREQHASFDTTAAQQDLGWKPTNDKQTLLEKGVCAPARLYIEN